MLHAGADHNMPFFTLRNISFEDGSIKWNAHIQTTFRSRQRRETDKVVNGDA